MGVTTDLCATAWGVGPELRRVELEPVSVAGVPVHPVTLAQTLDFIADTAESERHAVICYANAHAVNLAQKDRSFMDLLRSASLVFCDGKGVQWAGRWLGTPLPERMTPPDWIDDLCERCVERSHRLFLLGGRPGVADAAAEVLRRRHRGLEVRSHYGHFDMQGESNRRVLEEIRSFRPRVLLVGFGMPLQEEWIAANRADLEANVIIAVGAAFDYVAGNIARAPRWLTDLGLEWLGRLVVEPRRLWRRYLVGNTAFVYRVARQRVRSDHGARNG